MIREHAVWVMLVEKFPAKFKGRDEFEDITSLREVWKFVHSKVIGKNSGKQYAVNSSPFQVQVSILYAEDEAECGKL